MSTAVEIVEPEDCDLIASESIHENLENLSTFKLEDILQNNTNRKLVCLKGKFDSREGDAIVILEKTAFSQEHLLESRDYFTDKSYLQKIFQNDIYGDYKYFTNTDLNSIKTTIIHPATDKHIVKFSTHNCYIVDETPLIYEEIILPTLINEEPHLQWVFNILEHKSETERIVFEDVDPEVGFILLPDLKWSGELDTLYLLAIVHKKNLKSLRDLTDEHLPLLRNIKKQGTKAIYSKYGPDGSELRIYLHYQPSFYHLHVHFCALKHDAPGIFAEKAHLLSNVISNLEISRDYYKSATLPFVIRENHNLYNILVTKGILKANNVTKCEDL